MHHPDTLQTRQDHSDRPTEVRRRTIPLAETVASLPDQTLTRVSPLPEAPFTGASFGRYRLIREIGRGGMGVVWEAFDPELRRTIALKMLRIGADGDPAEEVARFVREARLAAGLRHPHILPVHDVGVAGGRHYFTTDLLEGGSLADRAVGPEAPAPAMPVREAVGLIREIALALDYAHRQGVLHRDVKPGNILLDGQGRPYVSDFGLAKELTPGASRQLTLSGSIVGTPSYMSPEQARGGPLGIATDQFSRGGACARSAAPARRPMALAWEYLDGFQPPGFTYTDTGIKSDGAPAETAALAELRRRLEESLRRVEAAGAWGGAGAPALRRAVAGILNAVHGEYRQAEIDLTAALATPELRPFDRGIRLARGIVRHLNQDYEGAIADVSEVARRRPGQYRARMYLGLYHFCAGVDGLARGEDVRGRLETALRQLQEAADLNPEEAAATHLQALAGWYRAKAALAHGEDPGPWLRHAKSRAELAIRLRPDKVSHMTGLGLILRDLGRAAEARREDPRADYDRSIAVYERILEIEPDRVDAMFGSSCGRFQRAFAEAARQGDPRPWLERGRGLAFAAAERQDFGAGTPCARISDEYLEVAQLYLRISGIRPECPRASELGDEAFRMLRRALELGNPGEADPEVDPRLAIFRADSRWSPQGSGSDRAPARR